MPDTVQPVWTSELSSDGVGGIAVAAGLVIVGGRDVLDTADQWVAVEADTGVERWRLQYPAAARLDYGNSPRATPLIVDGLVYLAGAVGHLHAVDAATGLVQWRKHLAEEFAVPHREWGLTGSPLAVGDKIIVQPGGRAAGLVAFDRKTGNLAWKTPGARPGHASLVAARFGGKTQVVGYDGDSLGGWNAANGARIWKISPKLSGDFNVPTPIVLDEQRLFVCTENNGARIYRLDNDGVAAANPLASYEQLNPDAHTPVVSEGRVYGVSNGLHCLDANDSLREIWVQQDDAFGGYVSLIAAGRRLLAYTGEAELVLLADEGQTARIVSRLKLDTHGEGVLSHPALVGSRLYARVGKRVVCLDLARE